MKKSVLPTKPLPVSEPALYPPTEPYRTGRLPVDDLHTLYWEECGNPKGVPVLFLHGGPGAGLSVMHRQFFDPQHYRIVLFDQRGAGKSTPLGEYRNNTTQLLVSDIEQIRQIVLTNVSVRAMPRLIGVDGTFTVLLPRFQKVPSKIPLIILASMLPHATRLDNKKPAMLGSMRVLGCFLYRAGR